jgi:hypothetical protein
MVSRTFVFWFPILCMLAGCADRVPEPECTELSFEVAQSALFDLLRSKSCQDLEPLDADKLAGIGLEIAEEESVAYWGPFRLNLTERTYELPVSVREPPRVCTQTSHGAFAIKDGRRVARPPSTTWALGAR